MSNIMVVYSDWSEGVNWDPIAVDLTIVAAACFILMHRF